MENRNIYKMDDFLIILSYLMILPTLFFAWPWLRTLPDAVEPVTFLESAPLILGARFNTVLLYAAGVVCVQFMGRIIRFKEKQSLKILDALGHSGKSSIRQLSMTTGLSESKVRSLARKLSRISSLEISVEDDKVSRGRKKSIFERPKYKVQDQRIPEAEVFNESFVSGEGDSSESVSMKINGRKVDDKDIPPEVQAIMKDPSLGLIARMKKIQEYTEAHPELNGEGVENLKKINSFVDKRGFSKTGDTPKDLPQPKKYKIILFALLMMSPLWPVAIIMAIVYVIKNKGTLLGMKDSVKKQ